VCSGGIGATGLAGVKGVLGPGGDTGATGTIGVQVIRRRVVRQAGCPGTRFSSVIRERTFSI